MSTDDFNIVVICLVIVMVVGVLFIFAGFACDEPSISIIGALAFVAALATMLIASSNVQTKETLPTRGSCAYGHYVSNGSFECIDYYPGPIVEKQ